MLTQEVALACVARGAAHLDRVRPGWFDDIDLDRLQLHDECCCIVGQLCRDSFAIGVAVLGMALQAEACGVAYTSGVYIDSADAWKLEEEAWRPLQDAWVEAIANRRLAAAKTNDVPLVEALAVLA
jgi:hypothetical protein